MSTWVAALVAAASITLTCVFCVRPMMHGRGRAAAALAEDPEIAQLRALRVQQTHRPPPQP